MTVAPRRRVWRGGPAYSESEVVIVTTVEQMSGRQRRSLRCLLGFHHWVVRRNDAGERYDECQRCGKADAYMPLALPRM